VLRPITTDVLLERIATTPDLVVLDVRTADEVAEWALPGVLNVPVEELDARLDEVPRDRPLAVLCLRGRRSATAAELLGAAGYEGEVVEGGMSELGRTLAVAERTVGATTIVQLRRVAKGCLSYLVGTGDRCAVIDPSGDLARLEALLERYGWTPSVVIDTHLHADHVSLAAELARRHGARLVLNDDGYVLDAEHVEPGGSIEIAPGVGLEVLRTPGHTTGSSCLLLEDAVLFSGDTLFCDSVGRPDLAERSEEFAHQLYATLHERLGALGDEVLVLPAHTAANRLEPAGTIVGETLGQLRRSLAAFSLDEPDFVSWASAQAAAWPPNYQAIVELNRAAGELGEVDVAELELGPNRCAVATTP
jgi:glyoxylase-like metal-dependent hydrolase (beta-lactamase superfamily II)/rhodanese-related sulfurtransferase